MQICVFSLDRKCKRAYLSIMEITNTQLGFLENTHASKRFMPAIEVKITTLHAWNTRGFMNFDKPGSGKSLYLSGGEIILARCLFILQKAGCAPSILGSRGLNEGIESFVNSCIEAYEENRDFEPEYLVYRVSPWVDGLDTGYYDAEWQLKPKDDFFGPHITEAHKSKAYAFCCVLDLSQIFQEMSSRVMKTY